MKSFAIGMLVTLGFVALGYAFDGPTDQEILDENYCQMVELFMQTDGENGWPDYRKSYARDCENR